MTTGTASRAAALDLLAAVLDRRRPLDQAIAAALRPGGGLAGLEARDRAFARLLVATTLRRLGQVDAAIHEFLERPLPPAHADAFLALRLGAAQLLFLDTPAHAAVSATVELVRHDPRRRGLVNAILRRIAGQRGALLAGQDAERLNTPGWLWWSWSAAYGEATARAIAASHLAEPPLDLTMKGAAGPWAERLGAIVLPTGSLRRHDGGAVETLPGYAEGAWWVQDAAAALPARLFGPVRDLRIADLCAAPGGKTAQLAAAGAAVTAVERAAPRLEIVARNLARLGLAAELVAADAAEWRPAGPLDGVLLDAPCTATGTIRRHPDIPHLKTAADVTALAALQDRLLAHAWTLLKPGGLLVYCTCSLEPEESEARIAALLAGGAALAREPVDAAQLGVPETAVTPAGDLRTLPCFWPERGGMDGFYACRLRRLA